MTDASPPPVPMQYAINLPQDQEVGVFADFASLWHTPNTFVLDFLAVKQPAQPVGDENGNVTHVVLQASVASRVRIPSEQVFLLINALQEQASRWLEETGRSEPPAGWMPGAG